MPLADILAQAEAEIGGGTPAMAPPPSVAPTGRSLQQILSGANDELAVQDAGNGKIVGDPHARPALARLNAWYDDPYTLQQRQQFGDEYVDNSLLAKTLRHNFEDENMRVSYPEGRPPLPADTATSSNYTLGNRVYDTARAYPAAIAQGAINASAGIADAGVSLGHAAHLVSDETLARSQQVKDEWAKIISPGYIDPGHVTLDTLGGIPIAPSAETVQSGAEMLKFAPAAIPGAGPAYMGALMGGENYGAAYRATGSRSKAYLAGGLGAVLGAGAPFAGRALKPEIDAVTGRLASSAMHPEYIPVNRLAAAGENAATGAAFDLGQPAISATYDQDKARAEMDAAGTGAGVLAGLGFLTGKPLAPTKADPRGAASEYNAQRLRELGDDPSAPRVPGVELPSEAVPPVADAVVGVTPPEQNLHAQAPAGEPAAPQPLPETIQPPAPDSTIVPPEAPQPAPRLSKYVVGDRVELPTGAQATVTKVGPKITVKFDDGVTAAYAPARIARVGVEKASETVAPVEQTAADTPVEPKAPIVENAPAGQRPTVTEGMDLHNAESLKLRASAPREAAPPVDKEAPTDRIEKPATPAADGETVGISHAFSAEQRRKLGLPERDTPETQALDEMYSKGKAATEADPELVDKILGDLRQNPERALTTTENGALTKDAVDRALQLHDLEQEVENAQASGDTKAEKLAKDRIEQHREESHERLLLWEQAGTAGGRALVSRRIASNLDYSLSRMESTAEKAKGHALNAAELAEVRQRHKELQSTVTRLQNQLEKLKETRAQEALDQTTKQLHQETTVNVRPPTRPLKPTGSVLAKLNAAAEAARARIKSRGFRLKAGLDPTELADYAVIGASHLANGLTKFGVWAAKMVHEFGEKIRPHLQQIFSSSREHLDTEAKAEPVDHMARIKERAAEGDTPDKMRPYFRELALDLIRKGVTTRDKLVDALHEQVKEAFPEITRAEVRDILSGYGDFKRLDNDSAKRQLREISGELQKVAQLEALARKERPLASGIERQPLSAKGRILQKLVNAAKKKAGITTSSGPGYLKSVLESAKTRLRNQINDLQTEIDTGKKIVRGKPTPISDAELVRLKAQVDKLREQHADIFPKAEMTDAQKLERATAVAKNTLDSWNQRVADARAGKFAGPDAPAPTNAEINALRAKAEAAREEYEHLRSIDPEQQALTQAQSDRAYKAHLIERRAEILDRIARGDFAPTPARPARVLDAETQRLRIEVEAAKRKWKNKLRSIEHANQSTGRKILRVIGEIPGVTKSLKASLDFSGLLRQGLGPLFTNPRIWGRDALKMFSDAWDTFGGKEVGDAVNAEMKASEYYPQAVRAKLAIGNVEEAFPSSLPDRIPFLGRAFKASADAYTAFLHRLRMHIFEKTMDAAKNAGVDINDPVQSRSIAKVVNSLTSRGDLGKFEPIADVVNNVFFSGRKWKADFDVLTAHSTDLSLSKFARKQAAMNLAKIVAGNAMVLMIAKALYPDSVEFDPRSSDFGQIRSGDTRYEVSGGRHALVVLAARMATLALSHFDMFHDLNSNKNSVTGKLSQINSGQFGAKTGAGALGDFAIHKLSPIASVLYNRARGERTSGGKPTLTTDAIDLLTPMVLTNIAELMQARGATPLSVATGAAADAVGIGTNTYTPRQRH